MTTSLEPSASASGSPDDGPAQPLSLGTAAARNLATTTKSVPQMQGISSRWLLRVLPWVEVTAGTYRVNRRLTHTLGDGRVEFVSTGAQIRVIPAELGELAPLRDFTDTGVLEQLADRFVQREYAPGDTIVASGRSADRIVLIAHGKADRLAPGKYGAEARLGILAGGDHLGEHVLTGPAGVWDCTVRAVTRCTVLTLTKQAFEEVSDRSRELRAHLDRYRTAPRPAANKHGEAAIDLASGHTGEPSLPGTFVDYEQSPREYELSVAQTVLRVHSRVADLYNEPMNQVEQQLRLTIEALRERQEHELVNNRDFGLLHNADLTQRIHTRTG
ncbi:family 2B encapsulin nanocompartment shell protein, partial [Streptomyces lycii]